MSQAGLGAELAARFYAEVVSRLVAVPHAAAFVGEGSEVLGYDSDRSTDHSWGPRVHVFTSAADRASIAAAIDIGLPDSFDSRPVRFYSWRSRTVRHHVDVTTVDAWLTSQIGTSRELRVDQWLAVPQQHLLQVTAGAVFRDDTGEVTSARRRLAWYPHDVWLWLMASQWRLIADSEALPGRAAEAGDVRGARLAVAQLVRLAMQMAFLHERLYWPYPKWLGTAFGQLAVSPVLGPRLDALLDADEPTARERALVDVLEFVAARHNDLGITEPVDPMCRPFQVGINDAVRPYLVLNAGRFSAACLTSVADAQLKTLSPVGSIDQMTHTSDLLVNFTDWPAHLARCYASHRMGS